MSYVWMIAGVLISAAAVVTMYRMPAVTMCGIGTWAAFSQDSTVTYPMAAIALISFVGTISVARFRVRDVERPRGGRGMR